MAQIIRNRHGYPVDSHTTVFIAWFAAGGHHVVHLKDAVWQLGWDHQQRTNERYTHRKTLSYSEYSYRFTLMIKLMRCSREEKTISNVVHIFEPFFTLISSIAQVKNLPHHLGIKDSAPCCGDGGLKASCLLEIP
jgi:hypothetical protein